MSTKTVCESVGINFSNLSEAYDLFPFSCSNGYYFLWNMRLPAPSEEETDEKIDLEALIKEEIARLKQLS